MKMSIRSIMLLTLIAASAQAAPFVVQKQLSHERLNLLVQELVATKEAAGPSPKEATALTP